MGFFKGTASSDVVECIRQLKCYIRDISHPLLLPFIILGNSCSPKRVDLKHRDARDWLRHLEFAIIARDQRLEIGKDM
jgi:hypothetical protein